MDKEREKKQNYIKKSFLIGIISICLCNVSNVHCIQVNGLCVCVSLQRGDEGGGFSILALRRRKLENYTGKTLDASMGAFLSRSVDKRDGAGKVPRRKSKTKIFSFKFWVE